MNYIIRDNNHILKRKPISYSKFEGTEIQIGATGMIYQRIRCKFNRIIFKFSRLRFVHYLEFARCCRSKKLAPRKPVIFLALFFHLDKIACCV